MKKYRNDIILIAVLIFLASAVWLYMSAEKENGAYAVITSYGEEVYRLPLDKDTTVVVESDKHINVITVKDGSVYMESASCPDNLCINQGKKTFDGEMIVCLPNELIIIIEGGKSSNIDDVAG